MAECYHKELSFKIIGCAFEVYNTLGNGYLEKVYERALLHELSLQGLNAVAQVPIKIPYKGILAGDYFADIIVENKIILELKSCISINQAHKAQLINYLSATGLKVGYLLNFGSVRKLENIRIVK